MDSLRLLTDYLTLTHIFTGRKANIYSHMTPKLTGSHADQLSDAIYSVSQPTNDAIILERSPLAPVLVLYFSVEARNKIVS